MATVLRLKELRLSSPGAIALGSPWCDITKTGDTWYTNEYIDRVVPFYEGVIDACARAYADARDLKHPLVSPVYGDLRGFPPDDAPSGSWPRRRHRRGQLPDAPSLVQNPAQTSAPQNRSPGQGGFISTARFPGNLTADSPT